MCKKFILSLVLVSSMSLGSTIANATSINEERVNIQTETRANVVDTAWSWSTFGNRGTKYTDARQKQNTTPAYVSIKSYGGKSDDYLQMYLVNKNKEDFRKRLVKTVSTAGKFSVSSYAYEDQGLNDVRMAFYAPYRQWYSWKASGVWSPDSTKNYG